MAAFVLFLFSLRLRAGTSIKRRAKSLNIQYLTLIIHPNTSMNVTKQRINNLESLHGIRALRKLRGVQKITLAWIRDILRTHHHSRKYITIGAGKINDFVARLRALGARL